MGHVSYPFSPMGLIWVFIFLNRYGFRNIVIGYVHVFRIMLFAFSKIFYSNYKKIRSFAEERGL